MIIGPRYKKARYLDAPIFRKTQTQKFSIRSQRKEKKFRGQKSEYGKQMLEKQKARFSYGVSGKQFTKYVKAALKAKGDNAKNLLGILESRLDNVLVRAGFAPTRSAGRQMVSHGHIMVDGVIVTIPSYQVAPGEVITIRDGSKKKAIFGTGFEELLKSTKSPAWVKIDGEKKEITISGNPEADSEGILFDIKAVLEFYTR